MITQHCSQEITAKEEPSTPSVSSNTRAVKFTVSDYHKSKILAERILGSILLVIAAPCIGLIVALVRLTSSGKGIYKQARVGKNGYEFSMYKIRTMYANAESCGNPQWSMPGDSRITPLGRMLRFLHLDELPQLANVALGQMSLIGPRPERPEFVTVLSKSIPNYLERLNVLPGVTGLAQINLPPDESLKSVRKKVLLDIDYIQHATAGLDFRILFCTAARMCGLRHGIARKLFRVDRSADVERFIALESLQSTGMTVCLDDTVVNMPALVAAQATQVAVNNSFLDSEKQELKCELENAQTVPELTPPSHDSATTVPRRPR